MNPYVYKKHHQPFQLLAVVYLFCIMILNQPVNSQDSHSCPHFAVKKVKIFSAFARGYVRVNGSKVVANVIRGDPDPNSLPMPDPIHLYKVTIDRHYMLLYHIASSKFICWNRTYKRLVAKRNQVNLTHCKFEDKLSKRNKGSQIRYTTNYNNTEIEIRFNKNGAFARKRLVGKCLERMKRHHKLEWDVNELLNLNPANIEDNSPDIRKYNSLTNCANPDFITTDVECSSGLHDFCERMKSLLKMGHTLSREIQDLCRKEWINDN